MPSFDVVSEVDLQEVDNAINQARKEVTQRYDFKGSDTEIVHEGTEIRINSSDEYKVKAVVEVLQGKAAKRQIPLKAIGERSPRRMCFACRAPVLHAPDAPAGGGSSEVMMAGIERAGRDRRGESLRRGTLRRWRGILVGIVAVAAITATSAGACV